MAISLVALSVDHGSTCHLPEETFTANGLEFVANSLAIGLGMAYIRNNQNHNLWREHLPGWGDPVKIKFHRFRSYPLSKSRPHQCVGFFRIDHLTKRTDRPEAGFGYLPFSAITSKST